MQDPFFEVVALQRIEMVTRLVLLGRSESGDKDLALDWVAELSAELLQQMKSPDKQNPQNGG